VITPRRTRLVRVPDLQAFRSTISTLVQESRVPICQSLIVVPTSGAAKQLQQWIPDATGVTRNQLYDALHARLSPPPRRLTAIERDVLAQASARAVAAAGAELSFQLRPGLVAEMIRFYDHVRRQSQQVDRFEALIDDALGGDELDHAVGRLRRQTRFLADAFREYERRARDTGACDEHGLREHLIAETAADPVTRIIVTVADWIADPDGLYVADFDLLARIPALESIEIVATEGVLASGFDERLHDWWPGIDEHRAEGSDRRPRLVTPPRSSHGELWWTHRDCEEELIAVARRVHQRLRGGENVALGRVAVVFKRPLPYLYLAPKVFGEAGIPYQTSSALPLASEPTAAALDLVLDAAASRFTRSTIAALLRSPHFVFLDGETAPTRDAVSALDRALSDARYLGESERLAALAANWTESASASALRVAVAIARELEPLAAARPASHQLGVLRGFWHAHLRPAADGDPFSARESRTRAEINHILAALEAAHAHEDDPPWSVEDLALAVRRAIEEETFVAASAEHGVQLIDDQAARYGAFDDVTIVGVVEADWPEKPRRNIFYPPSLIRAVGWPTERERRAGADARFLDLLGCASQQTAVSTFSLDNDALATRSVQLDGIPRARLSTVAEDIGDPGRVFIDERLSFDPPLVDTLDAVARANVEFRASRTPAENPDFHGSVADIALSESFSVSGLETYIECPFKYFARHVLRLDEEPDDEEVMDPRRQGQFVHKVFEDFFVAWQAAGHKGITRSNLETARELFTMVVDRLLETLPEAEAGLERARLLGSAAAAGLGEAVLRMEAERPVPVVARLLEHQLNGPFTIATINGPRTIVLRGKVDRLDLLDDGTFRLIDYKLGRAPNRARALQLPIYSLCAEQQLAGYHGRNWTLAEATYLAFKGPRRVVPLYNAPSDRDKVFADAQQRLADTVDAIARGEFPPRPDDVWRCEMCSFGAVCRKDYVGDV
jgi:RecB family exonuclease